jgi:trans-aconitate 2-methyltransferase
VKWDPYQYSLFSEARSRPFYDLFWRLKDSAAATIVDLGCGPGELTRLFAKRWHNSSVTGVDSSAEMLEIAKAYVIPGRLEFERGDIATWHAERPVDLLFSNAALQWVPDHEALIPRLAAEVAPGGRFAVQMPDNFDQPSHQAILQVLSSPRWQARLGPPKQRTGTVLPLSAYAGMLLELGFSVDAWQTGYLHVLEGRRPVLEWVKGTALRPTLSRLEPEEQAEFLEELGEELERAYPPGPHGTLFPFRRVFFIATRR